VANATQRPTAIAAGGAHWDIGSYRLWESAEPGVVLFQRRTLRLAADAKGRPLAAVTRYLTSDGTTLSPTGGAVTLTVLGVEPGSVADQAAQQDEWTRVLVSSGYAGGAPGTDPRYLPLPIKDVSLSAQVDAAEGMVAPNPEGTTLRVDLTKAGVAAWVAAINGTHPISGTVRASYAYPQLMPPATATALLHGIRCYDVLADNLSVAADGALSGSTSEVGAAWDELIRSAAIEVSFSGIPEAVVQGTREGLLGQVREYLFDSLFDQSVTARRTTYTFKWTRPADVPDFPLSISVGGWTWLTGSLESTMAELIAPVGPWAIHDVHESVSVLVQVLVAECDLVETVVVSLDFGDVRPPEVMTFDSAGGRRQLLVTTTDPDELAISHLTRVIFTPPQWPVITVAGTAATATGGYEVDVSDAWIQRLEVHAFLADDPEREGWRSEDDSLAVTLRFEHPLLESAISSTAPAEPMSPAVFRYPAPGDPAAGTCTLEALGSIGGRLVHVSGAVPDGDAAVILLVEGNGVRLIHTETPLPESDRLARQLRTSGAGVTVRRELPPASETTHDQSISLEVPLVPQATQRSGWAAALAMLVSARDHEAVTPVAVAERTGMSLDARCTWPQVRDAVAAYDLREAPFPEGDPAAWSTLLRRSGPVWLVRPDALHGGVVVAGLTGDGTPDGTWLRVLEPWPVRVGTARSERFNHIYRQFGVGSGERAVMVHR
jgi:hypothetical protein